MADDSEDQETNPLRSYFSSRPDETHATLAARCDMSIDTLRSYISGRRRPGVDGAIAIERATSGAVPVESWASAGALATPMPGRSGDAR